MASFRCKHCKEKIVIRTDNVAYGRKVLDEHNRQCKGRSMTDLHMLNNDELVQKVLKCEEMIQEGRDALREARAQAESVAGILDMTSKQLEETIESNRRKDETIVALVKLLERKTE